MEEGSLTKSMKTSIRRHLKDSIWEEMNSLGPMSHLTSTKIDFGVILDSLAVFISNIYSFSLGKE